MSNVNRESDDLALARGQFLRDGYLVVRGLMDPDFIGRLQQVVQESLNPPLAPLEFEADVHYPGSPSSRRAPGGETPRRLLRAYSRHPLFREAAGHPEITRRLQALMDSDAICVSQNHHNCVMTKHPGFSSVTSWHQDIRYWSFDRPELVSCWLALGDEFEQNGGLLVIPGTHDLTLDRGRFDAALFLRTDLEENQALIDKAIPLELSAGDVLFFHSRVFHAAGRNQTDLTKCSLVFTYHTADNQPIPETRSALYQDIRV